MDYLKVPKNNKLQFDTPQRDLFFSQTSSNNKLSSDSVLGKGAFGTVYSAFYKNSNVAIKIITKHEDESKFLSLKRESNIMNWCHPNIVRIFKIVETINQGAVVMENFKNSKSLQFLLDHCDKISLHHRLLILRDIASALSYCHDNQLCHADLKPLNIMIVIDHNTRNYVCKLFDFGCSFRVGSDDTSQLNATGTARYCAPEMLQGKCEVTTSIDIFSFAIVMWQLKENDIPYSAIKSNDVVIFQVVRNNLRPDSTILLLNELNEKLTRQEKVHRNYQYCKSDLFDTLKVSTNTPITRSANRKIPAIKKRDEQKRSRKNLFKEDSFCRKPMVENEVDILSPKSLQNLFCDTPMYSHDKLFNIENNYIKLYKACWQEDPKLRPSTSEVCKFIQQFHDCLEP